LLAGVIAVLVVAAVGAVVLSRHGSGPAETAPGFTMVAYGGQSELGGERVAIDSLVGRGKPVVLNFWAALCPPCRAEMPGYERIHRDLGSRILIVGVDLGPYTGLGSHEDARRFLRENGITYPTAYATTSAPLQEYRIQGMPTTIIFDGKGRIVSRHTGYFSEDQLRQSLSALVDSPGRSP